jgi:ribose transport system substrate-binding protein
MVRSRWFRSGRSLSVVGVLALCVTAVLATTSTAATRGDAAKKATAKVALVIPGPNAYFKPWDDAAKDASKKYGFSATFAVPASQEFNLAQQNQLVDSLAAKGYNGFGLFPGDANGTNAEAKKLAARGIKTININGCTYDPAPALFCVSTNVYTAALYQAQQLIKAIGGKGEIALLTSQLTDPNTQLRIQAVKKAVKDTQGKVKLAQIVANIDTPQSAPPAINALLASKGDTLAGAMSTSYNPAVAMATALTDNPQYRHIKFIGAENSPQVMNALRKGYIYGTLFQNTYGQAYVAAYALYKAIAKGCTVRSDAPFQTTPQTKKLLAAGVLIVNKSNIKKYSGPLESLPDDTARLMSLVDSKVLNCA